MYPYARPKLKADVIAYKESHFRIEITTEGYGWALKIVSILTEKEEVYLPDSFDGLDIIAMTLPEKETHPTAQVLGISKTLKNLSITNKTFPGLTQVLVAPDNESFSTDGQMLYNRNKSTLLYSLCGKDVPSITIPVSVYKIASTAFQYARCRDIVFENPDVSIMGDAFSHSAFLETHNPVIIGNCLFKLSSNVAELEIPEHVTKISPSAFLGYGATTIKMPTLFSHDEFFPYESYINPGEKLLQNIVITSPKGNIPLQELQKFKYLRSITVTEEHPFFETIDGVLFDKKQKTLLFYPPQKKDSSYTVPEGTKGIGREAFHQIEHLEELFLPDSVTFLSERAIYSNPNLKVLHLSDQIQIIPSASTYSDTYGAISNNKRLAKVHLPKCLTHVGYDAFYSTALTEVNLPEGLSTLSRYAFASMSLEKASLPKSLQLCESGSLYGAKEVTAYEGTAYGLVNAINPYTERDENRYRFTWGACRVRILSPEDNSFVGYFLIPKSLKASCATLLCDAWNRPHIDYHTYEQVYAGTKAAADKLELALILYFQAGFTDIYYDYIKKNAYKAASFLIETGQLERFTELLHLDLLTKASAKKLQDLCNDQQHTEYIAYLMDYQESKTKTRSSSRFAL